MGPSGGDGRNDGDPHLTTFDGTGYSFQAVGEFTMVLGDDFEIQTRTESINASVSVNTATSMSIGENVVGIYAREDLPLIINGTPVILEQEQTIAVGDGSVYRGTFGGGGALGDFDVYVVTDGKGNGFWVNVYAGANHLRPFVAKGGDVAGLLGNLNGERADDFQLRDGTVLPQPLAQDALYGEYADSWRISQADSLFIYKDGESTETFTDRSFPNRIITIDDLEPAARAFAEAAALAAGLTPGTFEFETTVMDIALTGDPIFAQGIAGAPVFAAEGEEVEIVPVVIDEAPTANADEATLPEDQAIDIDVLANDTDPENGPLTLLGGTDPNGGTVEVVEGRLRFTPARDFAGLAILAYEIADAAGNRAQGTIEVEVTPLQDDPSANVDTASTDEATPVTIDVLANDLDGDGDTLTVIGVDTSGTFGRATITADGRILYNPNGQFDALGDGDTANDSFAYTVSDGQGGTATATVNVTVAGLANGPRPGDVGTDGNDRIIASAGNDVIAALAGDDEVQSGNGDDIADGGDGDDMLIMGNGNDTARGGNGNDIINAGNGDDIVDGGPGNDTLRGGNGADRLMGGAGADDVQGGNGDDQLLGGEGDDMLSGGNGADILEGGAGADTLTGGNGPDTFVFRAGIGSDTVNDFRITGAQHDVLKFEGLFADQSDLFARSADTAEGALISAETGETVLLKNITLAQLQAHPEDLHFV